MLKILFGKYSKEKNIKIQKSSLVLDIGCGFGNNLLPFLEKKVKCYGIEINPDICKITSKILKKKNLSKFFKTVETERVIEFFNTRIYDVFLALCRNKR